MMRNGRGGFGPGGGMGKFGGGPVAASSDRPVTRITLMSRLAKTIQATTVTWKWARELGAAAVAVAQTATTTLSSAQVEMMMCVASAFVLVPCVLSQSWAVTDRRGASPTPVPARLNLLCSLLFRRVLERAAVGIMVAG